MIELPFRSAWEDPNVKMALRSGRPATDIHVICCQNCGNYGYYNDGSHFSCSVEGCEWSVRGRRLDSLIDQGEVISLDDYMDMMVADEELPHPLEDDAP
jgi:hypothetical protein